MPMLTTEQAKALDKYYTPYDSALFCVQSIEDLHTYDAVLEPSAGAGVFLDALEAVGYKGEVIALDLVPEDPKGRVQQCDFFDWVLPEHLKGKRVLCLGNPPYGKRNSLTLSFIKHAAKIEEVATIALIVPNSMRIYSFQAKLPLNLQDATIVEMQSKDFTVLGKRHKVNVAFMVWPVGDTDRAILPPRRKTTPLFSFSNKGDESGDLSFIRWGAGSGKDFYPHASPGRGTVTRVTLDGLITMDQKDELLLLLMSLDFPEVPYFLTPCLPIAHFIEVVEPAWCELKGIDRDKMLADWEASKRPKDLFTE